MNSDQKVPIWWPPRIGDFYDPNDDWSMKLAKAAGGWLSFVVWYGGSIFFLIFIYSRLFDWHR